MTKYYYEVTGIYKDNLKMKKDDILLHDGNLVGLILFINGRLELNLNYGKKTYFPCELKKLGDMIITVPHTCYLNNDDYVYIPLVFDTEDYERFVEITYIDKALLDKIQKINKEDISNLLVMRFKKEFSILKIISFKEIIDNIVAYSEEDDSVSKYIKYLINKEMFNIKKINENDMKYITLYIDFSGQLYEWNTIFKYDGKFYIKLIDNYAIDME